ncbi:MAG: hypothetical protein DRI57_21815 [Deltaproteobacteria bacterium]|nr:MAG: hypothetical protein DRI57_21815 [Deltaproteobacteria bacterium]
MQQDMRYDPEFEKLQSEIGKLSSPTGATNWEKVSRLAAGILEEKSKDLLVASYLAVARIHTDGADGLAPGLTIFRYCLLLYNKV